MKNVAMLLLLALFFFGVGTLSIVMSFNERVRRKLRPKFVHHGLSKTIDRIVGIILGVMFWLEGLSVLRDFFRK